MIAKAILEMFTTPPGATRSSVQLSGQPLQTFSDSLLTASKSFLQGITSDSGKTGRRQRSTSDDAATTGTATDRGAVLLPVVPQQIQANNTDATPLQAQPSASTATEERTSIVACQFAQNVAALESVGTESISTRQTGVQQSVTEAQMPVAGPATTQMSSTTSTTDVGQPARAFSLSGLGETESNVAQAGVIPANIVAPVVAQSEIDSVEVPVSEPATAEETSTDQVNQPASTVMAAKTPEAESSIAPASIVQQPIAQSNSTPTTTEDILASMASLPNRTTTTSWSSETQSVFAQTNVAPAETSRQFVAQSNSIPVQAPLATPATTQDILTGPANIVRQFAIQSNASLANASLVQTPIAMPATTLYTLAGEISQPVTNATAAWLSATQLSVIQANVVAANIPQSADVRSNVSPVVTPLAAPATTQDISTGVTSQPVRNATAAWMNETQPSFTQPGASHVEMISVVPATPQADLSGLTGENERNVTPAGSRETESIVAPARIVLADVAQPATGQSVVPPVQMLSAMPVATEEISNRVTSQPVRNTTATRSNETESNFTQANVVSENIARPSADQSIAPVVQMIPVKPAATQDDLSGPVNETTHSARPSKSIETESVVAPLSVKLANITQADQVLPPAAQLSVASTQAPLAPPAVAQDLSTGVTGQAVQNATPAWLNETQSSFTQANVVPAGESQPAVIRSSEVPVQVPHTVSTSTQNIMAGQVARATQNAAAAELPVSQPNTAQVGSVPVIAAQKDIAQPVRVQPSATPLNNDMSRNSSKLTGVSNREQKASTAALPHKIDDHPSAVITENSDVTLAAEPAHAQDSLPAAGVIVPSNPEQIIVTNDTVEPSPVPVLHAAPIASVKDTTAPALQTVSTGETDSKPAVPDQSLVATTVSLPGGIADQLAVSSVPAGSLGANQNGVSRLKSVTTAKAQAAASKNDKGSGTEQAGSKKDAEAVIAKGIEGGVQDVTPSGDQSQSGSAIQAQDAAPIAVNFAAHAAAVIDAAQNTATASPVHASTSQVDTTATAKTTSKAYHVATSLPQIQPVINTARLIQSMGQSEMRVGMRSNEFGSISISTSTTRDQVSAQISLEHGELAKALAAHLPEMQARLGSNQPMDVRIDMNGAATGQGTGTFGGASHGSSDQSHSGRQQASNMVASHSSSGVAEQQFSPVAAVMPTGYARLDIRV